jgi:hypothetical protein
LKRNLNKHPIKYFKSIKVIAKGQEMAVKQICYYDNVKKTKPRDTSGHRRRRNDLKKNNTRRRNFYPRNIIPKLTRQNKKNKLLIWKFNTLIATSRT